MESCTEYNDPAETDLALQHSENDSLHIDSVVGMKNSVSAQTDITSIFSLSSAQDQHSVLSQQCRHDHPVHARYQTSVDFDDLSVESVGSFSWDKLE